MEYITRLNNTIKSTFSHAYGRNLWIIVIARVRGSSQGSLRVESQVAKKATQLKSLIEYVRVVRSHHISADSPICSLYRKFKTTWCFGIFLDLRPLQAFWNHVYSCPVMSSRYLGQSIVVAATFVRKSRLNGYCLESSFKTAWSQCSYIVTIAVDLRSLYYDHEGTVPNQDLRVFIEPSCGRSSQFGSVAR